MKSVLPKIAFERNARIYKVLANQKRLEILNNIKFKERSVQQLLEITGLPKANLSQHLALLRHNRLVFYRKEGLNVYYRIVDPNIIEPCVILHHLWKRKALV
ncbi:MAG: hypothetical protein A3C06_04315 [Candidatus Taylorbacteria bacterium RIFCSPHIGHO2_02_FULL_46_13]|uniref:HTH arsR-type domain-containing protein n=1 Tax=Candidatus Taylorbacteria bacterium RIFCSPHIGHO2_02_FULL_46_13 TaxID=1802312 RepID=A0A1G2MSV7_9BACT|nr:MAG: hypothetical protein A3C06_04315 [Candidatus Taylorbacteria bacterium RIFCSPHIGHO2_02_FULL_46_13]